MTTVAPAIRFLQGRDPSLALRIVGREFLPEGPRFAQLTSPAAGDDPLAWAFGSLGTTDQARYLASLYVDDLADVWRHGIDPHFELARYGEKLAASAPTFEPLAAALDGEPTLVDEALAALTRELVATHRPDVVGMSAPFPGNVYGAFRMARVLRDAAPAAKLVLGGGWVNTELRALREPRVFDYFDYVTLDDGERPLLNLLARLQGRRVPLVRTYVRKDDAVALETDATQTRLPAARHGHADLRRSAARELRLRHGNAESDASPVVRRPLEQDHARARLLLEEVQLLRRVARLYRPLRPARHRRRARAHPRAHRGNGPDGLSSRRRSGAAGRHACAGEAAARREPEHHVVGQHPLRENLHAGAVRPARRSGLRGRQRRPRGRVESPARAHEERRHRRASRARHARVHGRRHHGARLSDVRLPERNRAGNDRRVGARAAAVRSGLHPIRLLASVQRDGALARRLAPRAVRHHVAPAARRSRSRTTISSSTIPSAPTTTSSAPGLRKALYNYMLGVGLDADVRTWFEAPRAAERRGRGRRPRRRAPAVPATTVEPELIARCLAQ